MVGVVGEILFPFSWTSDPKAIVRVDSCVFPPLDCEVIKALKCFLPLECNILIARDRDDGNGVEEYLGTRKGIYFYGCILCMGAF